MLFNGVVTGYCNVAFYNPYRWMWYANVGEYCRTGSPNREHQHPRLEIERPSCSINIRKLDGNQSKEFSSMYRVVKYQNRLVHEMLHAVFEVYTCYCSGCFKKNRSYLLAGSHGEPWLAAAHVIEQADTVVLPEDHDDEESDHDENGEDNKNDAQKRGIKRRRLLGLNLKKDRAVAFDVHNGANLPPESELRRLGGGLHGCLGGYEDEEGAWSPKAQARATTTAIDEGKSMLAGLLDRRK